MKTNAWIKFAAIGFAASLFAAGCVVNSTTEPGDGGLSGGGTGGTATGGTGGTTGGTGGTTTGGTGGTATGGTGGAAPQCNSNATDSCQKCQQTTCCNEWLNCQNDATCKIEFACIQTCIDNARADAGTADAQTKQACVGKCAQAQSGIIVQSTNDLFACVNDTSPEAGSSCTVACFGG